ncbi:LodA/GoxA family CTQ-dependent oxidase [Catellatospora sp. NPDC049609]|uniref:LodA/GoxA family CTQ-dependent oxidase n=1 Tax=Catellatospora sp. NPDC049609 TaxID=3155505 RepID=UPI003423F163
MATTYRIHPAIGIARVGNSPDEFFVGPERVGELPEPPGGFKDAQCRIKRQAARFRIYAHHDDGTFHEVTDAEADITWTVHVVNAKAAHPGRGNGEPAADLTIDPGPRTLSGPDQRQTFDGGVIRFAGQAPVSVPLGEARTDDTGRLLVLGGHGAAGSPAGNLMVDFWANPGWYDDVADGPVTAVVTLRGSGETPAVAGAWVVVAPPKFAPHQDSVITLYDRVLQHMIDLSLVPAPATTSYTRDIHPILQRTRQTRWVEGVFGAHSWPDPVTAQPLVDAIADRLRPAGDMPALSGVDSVLTATQQAHVQRWRTGAYTADWSGTPTPQAQVSPDGLDRAALEACVGGAFFPGIEAGGLAAGDRPVIEAPYVAPFRLAPSVAPGTISGAMALPWQADFSACGDNWWPVPRPNDVTVQKSGVTARWDRDVTSMDEMVARWHTLGFVVRQGDEHVEVDHCEEATVTLLTPHLRFTDVPQGPMGMVRETSLAIAFEVLAPRSAVTLEYAPGGAPGDPQLVAVESSVTVGPTTPGAVATARLWLVYRTGAAPSAIVPQTLTVREPVSGQTWRVTVEANTVARRTTATALLLDRPAAVSDDGRGATAVQAAQRQAAGVFADLAAEGDGVAVVRLDGDLTPPQPVLRLGAGGPSDVSRNAVHAAIDDDGPGPHAALADGGSRHGRGLVDTASAYDQKTLVVLADGGRPQPRTIAAGAGRSERTYAVGLGRPSDFDLPALQALSANNGGFLLVTGDVDGGDRFLPQKYLLQVLAGVNDAEVVLDCADELRPDLMHRIPFQLSDADTGMDVMVLTDRPDAVDFRLQTPNGLLLEPWRARAEPAMRFEIGQGVAYYRIALPVQLRPQRFDQAGTWHAVVRLGPPRLGPTDDADGVDRSVTRGRRVTDQPRAGRRPLELERAFAVVSAPGGPAGPAAAGADQPGRLADGVAYGLVVHAYSNASLRAYVQQLSYEPGADVLLRATLTLSGLPLRGEASVWAEITPPVGAGWSVELADTGQGAFAARFATGLPGVYRVRVRARGRTRSGRPFTRERTLTPAVWHGADRPGVLGGRASEQGCVCGSAGQG